MKVETIVPKEWNDKKFAELKLDGKLYSCWQSMWTTLKVGDELQGEVVNRGEGKTPHIKITSVNGTAVAGGKGGFRPTISNEATACGCAKDITIAVLNAGTIKTSAEIDATLDHFFKKFMVMLK